MALVLEDQEGVSCMIIEKDPGRCEFLAERLNKAVVLLGDGSGQELLTEENVGDMDEEQLGGRSQYLTDFFLLGSTSQGLN
jgi:hypothetical protein